MPGNGLKAKIDRYQQAHAVPGFIYGVVKKYGEDQGNYLAALTTFFGFLSIFPLLLAFFTVAAWVLKGRTDTLHTLEHHLGSYPIIGQAVTSLAGHTLSGSVLALVIGVVGLILGAQGLAQTLIFVCDQIWNIPYHERIGTVPKYIRGIVWYTVFGIGAIASTFINSLSRVLNWGPAGAYIAALPALAVNIVLFFISFRILTNRSVPSRALFPGAAVSGVVWTIINSAAIGLSGLLHNTNPLYGSFAGVLGLLAFIYLNARVTTYAAEANVVAHERLWPRSLSRDTPTEADKRQLESTAKRESRNPEAHVSVEV
ncbi:MAG: YihY/virulence factor BrkB family protein [Acidimicrobiaceae bacterium]|nr:YihY/virulence factor BrkB family protein [Acidimicrobiaceae bacterium]MBO0747888.1 YihY/virulence factor BrkB family protein [Acidimicrobiaceae bacterium]